MSSTSPAPNCPDCECPMDTGFIPDFNDSASTHAVVQALWHPGDVETRTFLGFKTGVNQPSVEADSALRRPKWPTLFEPTMPLAKSKPSSPRPWTVAPPTNALYSK